MASESMPRDLVDHEEVFIVLFAIPTLGGGGAERMILWLARKYKDIGAEVHILTMSEPISDVYTLPSGVARHSLALDDVSRSTLGALTANFTRILELRRIVKSTNAHAVISFTTTISVLSILSCLGIKCVCIACERSNPAKMRLNVFWTLLRRFVYGLSDGVVTQSQRVADWMILNTRAKHVVAIPNPVVFPLKSQSNGIEPADILPKRARVILGAGRLVSLKGFDVLLNAFKSSCGEDSDWHLVILGNGEERERLESLAVKYNLKDRVHLPGRTENMTDWYVRSDIFVLSSKYEGFPNVLMEAMAHGTAVISTDCEYGPREIIKPELNGLLVPVDDAQSLSEAISRLKGKRELRKHLGDSAKQVRNTYSPDKIFAQWIFRVDEILKKNRL